VPQLRGMWHLDVDANVNPHLEERAPGQNVGQNGEIMDALLMRD